VFSYDASAPLNVTQRLEYTRNDIEVSAIEFDSPAGGRATGFLFVPVTRSSLRPGLILQHGMPGHARGEADAAQLFAERGAVVIALDAPFARRAGSPVRFTSDDAAEQIQLIKDLRRAVDVLRSRVELDAARIGYRGTSYGAAMGSLFAGVERRVKTFVLAVGDGGLVSHFTGSDDQPGPLASLTCADRVRWLRAMTPIEPIRFVGLAAPASLFIQSGEIDRLIPLQDARDWQNAASQPKTVEWYNADHGLNQAALDDQLNWLQQHIGTDPQRR
jgi:dienelactone hydrolase